MKQRIKCLSYAPRAKKWLDETKHAQVLHRFPKVLNLVNENRDVFSIVVPAVGNGPFAAVVEVEDFQGLFGGGERISVKEERLQVGNTLVSFDAAEVWDPVLDWREFYLIDKVGLVDHIESQLSSTSMESGMAEVFYLGRNEGGNSRFVTSQREGSSLILDGLANHDTSSLKTGAASLAGLGVGLTPTGDDFLMGVMYGLQATKPSIEAEEISTLMYEVASGRTTSLSAAWLKAASLGEAAEKWHELVRAVLANQTEDIQQAIQQVIDTGETSGADALTGFVQVLKLELRI